VAEPVPELAVLIVGNFEKAALDPERVGIVLAERIPSNLDNLAIEVFAIEQLNPFFAVRIVLGQGGGCEKNQKRHCSRSNRTHVSSLLKRVGMNRA
jgi:hypothetical protein